MTPRKTFGFRRLIALMVSATFLLLSHTAGAAAAQAPDADPLFSATGKLLRVPVPTDFPHWQHRANVVEGLGIPGVTVRFNPDSSFFQVPGLTTTPSLTVLGKMPDGQMIDEDLEAQQQADENAQGDEDADEEELAADEDHGKQGYHPVGDIVLIAWSDSERRIVAEFSHTLEGPDFAIDPERFAVLPQGIVELQAVVRLDSQIVQFVRHPCYVSYELPLAQTQAPEDSQGLGPDETPSAPEDLLRSALEEFYKIIGPDIPGLTVRFDTNNAVVYEIGSDNLLHLSVEGTPPDGVDVVMVAWSVTHDQEAELFAHTPLQPGYQVDPAFMENLPPGLVLLQALVREDGKVKQLIQAPLLVVVGGDAGEDGTDWVLEPDYDTSFDDLPPGETFVEHPTDDAGWTVLPLASDAHVVYVSSSQGQDSNDGRSPETAVRTPDRGKSLLRDGKPDRILFKRGDTFSLTDDVAQQFRRWDLSGRSSTQPMVIGAYGELGVPRPRFLTNDGSFITVSGVRHLALLDLYVTANYRDPNSPSFKGGQTVESGLKVSGKIYDLLVEGCLFEYFSFNIAITNNRNNPQDMRGLTFRRNVIRYAYNPWDRGHSQGFFCNHNVRGVRLSENIFDHNGWNARINRANRTGFNHNVYLKELHDLTVDRNIFVRGSLYGLKLRSDGAGMKTNVRVYGNLFADNIEGMRASVDHVGDSDSLNIIGLHIDGNVFTELGGAIGSTPLGNAITIKNTKNAVIRQNLIFKKNVANNWSAIAAARSGPHDAVKVLENVVHRWKGQQDMIYAGSRVTVSANRIGLADREYADPTASLDHYARDQAGLPDRFALYQAINMQRKGYWRTELTSDAITTDFRAAFGLRAPDWGISDIE